MLNIASETIKTNNTSNVTTNTSDNNNNFPTVGLKSLLQNSDLLELLLKPLETTTTTTSTSTTNAAEEQSNSTSKEDSKKSPPHDLNDTIFKYNSLFDVDILDECLESKASKIENEDTSLSKYGNAFFGQSLWEKSEIYQSDKIGVKFEYLEVDDFLNENGLNEADVEFLDQLQKYESVDASNKATQQTANKSQTSPSPFAPSPSSQSSSSSSNHSLKSLLDAPMSSNEKTQSNRSAISAHSINMSSGQNMYKDKDTLNKTPQKLNKKQEKNWSTNDLSMGGSISDYESEDDDDELDSSLKMTEEELKLNPIMKKSKKKFVPDELKDDKYWARRRKNNVAAKRSRDARRMKENQIAVRATYLERENDLLRKQLEDFKRENKVLKIKLARFEANPNMEIMNAK